MEYKSSNQLLTEVKSKQYKPLYVLHGEEAFFIDQISDFIENSVLTDGEKAFNQVVLYGKDIVARQIIDEAMQFPMMSERRVVIVKEAQDMSDLKELDSYIAKPAPHAIVVLAHKNKKIDGRLTWIQVAKKSPHIAMLHAQPIKEGKLVQWVDGYLRQKNRKISQPAKLLLCEYLGTDLKKLVNEINKLELNIAKDVGIEVDHVEKYVGISKDYNVFELNKAIGARDVLRTHVICNNLIDNIHKSPPQMLIPAMFSHFQKSHLAKRVGRRSNDHIAGVLRISSYYISDYITTADNYSESAFKRIFELLKVADGQSKGINSRKTDSAELIKGLVSEIVAQR